MDLANVSAREGTRRREGRTFIPRAEPSTKALEDNARINRPDTSGAEALRRVLGMAEDTANNIIGASQAVHNRREAERSNQAEVDFAAGKQDPNLFAKSKAYHKVWSVEGAKAQTAVLSQTVTQAVNDLFNDPDDPPTPEEVNATIDQVYHGALVGEDGKIHDFGAPEANAYVGHTLSAIRRGILYGSGDSPGAIELIRKAQNEKLGKTVVFNLGNEWAMANATASPKVDPLAPLPEGTAADPGAGISVQFEKPTGKLPVTGKITSTFTQHEKRGSHGLDIAAKLGTPIELPAGGKVIEVGHDKRSGLFVKVDHGNGVVSSYAHLSSASVQKGAVLQPGARVGTVGQSGHATGPHVHYRVKVGGKDVDPLTFDYGHAGTQMASSGQPAQPAQAPELAPKPVSINFEEAMTRFPTSIPRGEAKKMLMQGLVNWADANNQPGILDGLEHSKRKDGTPSFSPDETAQIINARQKIEAHVQAVAEHAQVERWKAGRDKIVTDYLNGKDVTDADLRSAVANGDIDPDFAYSFSNQRHAEAKAEQREQDYEEEQGIDGFMAGEVAARSIGAVGGATHQSDLELLNSGKLGTGKKALGRFRQLEAAREQGGRVNLENPRAAYFGAQLRQNFGTKPAQSSSLVVRSRAGASGYDPARYAAMSTAYEQKVKQGIDPGTAYNQVVNEFVPKTKDAHDARQARIKQLEARVNGGR